MIPLRMVRRTNTEVDALLEVGQLESLYPWSNDLKRKCTTAFNGMWVLTRNTDLLTLVRFLPLRLNTYLLHDNLTDAMTEAAPNALMAAVVVTDGDARPKVVAINLVEMDAVAVVGAETTAEVVVVMIAEMTAVEAAVMTETTVGVEINHGTVPTTVGTNALNTCEMTAHNVKRIKTVLETTAAVIVNPSLNHHVNHEIEVALHPRMLVHQKMTIKNLHNPVRYLVINSVLNARLPARTAAVERDRRPPLTEAINADSSHTSRMR